VPIITNTVTPVTTGPGVVTGSVQYQDVGLKLEFEPQVYSDQEVGIRISLEVSSIVKDIPGPNGSLAYQIGTRNAQTVVRLRDGETQILGGLISSEDRNTSSRVPGLGHLPMVGKLFGNNSGTGKKTEVVLSITPRIIRPPAVLDASVRTVFSGTETSIRERMLQLDPVGSASVQSTGGPLVAAPTPAGRVSPLRPTPPVPAAGDPAGSQQPATAGPFRGRVTPQMINSNRDSASSAAEPRADAAAPAPAPDEPKAPQ
jgi:general secretion pathway protein D